jgi:hypothetical protein
MNDYIALIIALLGGGTLSTLITLWFMRRRNAAEREKLLAEAQAQKSSAENTDVEAFDKFSDLLKKLQDRNDELYKKTVVLEKEITERDRSLEVLADRLQSRDSQLATSTKQLELLRGLAEESHITETLKEQLGAMQLIIAKMQDAQSDTTKMLAEKERINAELFKTNRDLELKKPPTS